MKDRNCRNLSCQACELIAGIGEVAHNSRRLMDNAVTILGLLGIVSQNLSTFSFAGRESQSIAWSAGTKAPYSSSMGLISKIFISDCRQSLLCYTVNLLSRLPHITKRSNALCLRDVTYTLKH